MLWAAGEAQRGDRRRPRRPPRSVGAQRPRGPRPVRGGGVDHPARLVLAHLDPSLADHVLRAVASPSGASRSLSTSGATRTPTAAAACPPTTCGSRRACRPRRRLGRPARSSSQDVCLKSQLRAHRRTRVRLICSSGRRPAARAAGLGDAELDLLFVRHAPPDPRRRLMPRLRRRPQSAATQGADPMKDPMDELPRDAASPGTATARWSTRVTREARGARGDRPRAARASRRSAPASRSSTTCSR